MLFRNAGEPVLNLDNPKGLPPALQRLGLDVLRQINQGRYEKIRAPEIASRIASYELASRMQTAAPELIDLSKEKDATKQAYGLNRPEPKGGGRGKLGNTYQDFARNCLLARRLVERGVRFINIVYASWDHHSNLDPELKYNAGAVDQPIAALIDDLKQRGLLDDTLVLMMGEFGRSPVMTKTAGRGHWARVMSMIMAGGGLNHGRVLGSTDRKGYDVASRRVGPSDLAATVFHHLGSDLNAHWTNPLGRPIPIVTEGGHPI